MKCVTCRSPRVSKFLDSFGDSRIFCRNCWVSFPESNTMNPTVHTNFAAVGEGSN